MSRTEHATAAIDEALTRALAGLDASAPPKLASAIRYAVFPGGARVRPRLCDAVARACGGAPVALIEAASCAVELLHCASLVHDDLPCFDDAELRRGRPSVHRAYGEALAVLAGDALIVAAFETMTSAALASDVDPARALAIVSILARATGANEGLVAGQAWESEPTVPLARYHRAKTAALFVAATTAGAVAAGADPRAWRLVGERLGEAYQVADDLLDAHGVADGAGKPTGRDASLARPSIVGEEGTTAAIARLRSLAVEAADAVPDCAGATALRAMILAIAERLVPASLQQSAA